MKVLIVCLILQLAVPKYLTEYLAGLKTMYGITSVLDILEKYGLDSCIPLSSPINGEYYISSGYGMRADPITHHQAFHNGIDISVTLATLVHSTADGEVVYVGQNKGYGRYIVIRYDYGFSAIYAHLSEYYTRIGKKVSKGEVIGFVGSTGKSTGYHLHYEIRKDSKAIEPVIINKKMKLIEKINYLNDLATLIRNGNTGNMETISKRLGKKRTTVYYALSELKSLGADIVWDSGKLTYRMLNDIKLEVTVIERVPLQQEKQIETN